MKRQISFLFITTLILISVGCSPSEETSQTQNKVKPVKVLDVTETTSPITLDYIGNVQSQDVKKYSFKSPGQIKEILVKKGQFIKKGEALARLDTKDLQYAVDASQAQLKDANAQYQRAINGATSEELSQAEWNVTKAQDAYDYAKDQYSKLEKLYESGAISKSELEKAELQMKQSESDVNIAKEVLNKTKKGLTKEEKQSIQANVEQARTQYNQKKDLLEDATITSDVDGYIVDVLYEEGERVDAGYPVIVTRNKSTIIRTGIIPEDLEKIKIGTKIIAQTENKEIKGVVTTIGSTPDPQTRTYDVEISLEQNTFPIGSIVNVSFVTGEKTGIWVPITSVMANGDNYLFVIKDEEARKQKVTLGPLKGTEVFVSEGLSNKDQIVIEGMKSLSNGDSIRIEPLAR